MNWSYGLSALIEPDHIVAEPPGVGFEAVALVAVRLGIADEVEPVPAPLLTIVGGGQKAVDQPGISVGGGIRDEGPDLGGGRRQTDQVVGGAADQLSAGGGRIGREVLGRSARLQERVDRAGGRHGRDGRGLERAERPVGTVRGGDGVPWLADVRGRLGFLAGGRGFVRRVGPGGTHLDPAGERLDLLGGELPLGGHLGPLVADGREQGALLGIARHDRGTGIAAREDRGPRVEPQPRLDLGRSVAAGAAFDEDRANLGLEEAVLFRRRRGIIRRQAGAGQRPHQQGHKNPRRGRPGAERHHGSEVRRRVVKISRQAGSPRGWATCGVPSWSPEYRRKAPLNSIVCGFAFPICNLRRGRATDLAGLIQRGGAGRTARSPVRVRPDRGGGKPCGWPSARAGSG